MSMHRARSSAGAQFVEMLESRQLLAAAAVAVMTATALTQPSISPITQASGATTAPAIALAAPAQITAASNARSHRVTVSWGAVTGATGYLVERNDGSRWTTGAQLGTVQTYEDQGLI